ncbi:MAG: transposase [Muribaculaceae bacterium]|nr:transposase [Muribaculaceae bacterium]
MNWEEFQQKKRWAGEAKPSMKRRRIGHDYKSRCIYMITLVVKDRQPLLGHIAGDGQSQPATMQLSALGVAVQQALLNVSKFYNQVKILTHKVMPDHLHFVIFVTESLPVHLGVIINAFRVACNREFRAMKQRGDINSKHNALWEEGYNDHILDRKGQLANFKNYIHDNPRRFALKRSNPDLFRVRRNVEIAGLTFAAQGNIFLLDAPELLQVQCSRKMSEEEIKKACHGFLSRARDGAVLVSPSISKGEKVIMRTVFENGFPVIVLRENGFVALAKPEGRFFDACAIGRLLLLAPWEHHNERLTITRVKCHALNDMARAICERNLNET